MAREEATEAVEQQVLGDLEAVEKDLRLASKMRMETGARLRSLVDEVQAELGRLLEEERSERETANNSLLSLLEESCYRIERNFGTID